MAERLRLFLIIALGEVVITTATAIAESPTEPATILAGVTRFEPVPRLRSSTTGSSRIPSDLARRTRPVWQCQAVPALSARDGAEAP
jgi:hypothetical protein